MGKESETPAWWPAKPEICEILREAVKEDLNFSAFPGMLAPRIEQLDFSHLNPSRVEDDSPWQSATPVVLFVFPPSAQSAASRTQQHEQPAHSHRASEFHLLCT